jgi:predicted nucleic acid-binding protein
MIELDARIEVVPATDELFRRGVELYRQRPDKDWPLTDCLSFVAMDDHQVTDALTGDAHFHQAGFAALLSGP